MQVVYMLLDILKAFAVLVGYAQRVSDTIMVVLIHANLCSGRN